MGTVSKEEKTNGSQHSRKKLVIMIAFGILIFTGLILEIVLPLLIREDV